MNGFCKNYKEFVDSKKRMEHALNVLYPKNGAKTENNLLIISGDKGLGKTHDVEEHFKQLGIEIEKPEDKIDELLASMFRNPYGIFVFDDVDTLYANKKVTGMLHNATNTQYERCISRNSKYTIDLMEKSGFDCEVEDTEDAIRELYSYIECSDWKQSKKDEMKRMAIPTKFKFYGKFIIITNKTPSEIGRKYSGWMPMISRAICHEIYASINTKLDILKNVCSKWTTYTDGELKQEYHDVAQEVIGSEWFVKIAKKYPDRVDLRTYKTLLSYIVSGSTIDEIKENINQIIFDTNN